MSNEHPKKSVYRPRPISGFVEHLPEWRAVEQDWLDKIRATFESFGFAGIETPVVEAQEALRTKAEIDKEIYQVERLHAARDGEKDEADEETRLALHYDLTVPLARYTAQHFNDLVFPFKRYQMQKVWRGERPQAYRYREFMQCDIDVINIDGLPLHFDAEMPLVIYTALQNAGVEGIRLHISNRKILEGYLTGLGFTDYVAAIRILDKADKISKNELVMALALPERFDHTHREWPTAQIVAAANQALAIGEIKTTDTSFVDQVRKLGVSHPLLDEGLEELAFVMERLSGLPKGAAIADLSIARGFDYYTGTVYELKLDGFTGSMATVGGGGRYEDLAGRFINKKLPGVGISIGLTRLFYILKDAGRIQPGRRSPADVLVILWSEEKRAATEALANSLRARGIKTEMYHAPQKISRQMSYAEKKNIPFVWFPPQEANGKHEVKDMVAGTQSEAQPETWNP